MIDALSGRVLGADDDGSVIECGGLAFRVRMARGAARALRIGSDVRLACQLLFREDVFVLFGFAKDAERDAFNVLRGVTGLGPEKALVLLGSLSPAGIAAAVRAADSSRFTAIKGIGPRLGERLLVELKGRLDAFEGAAEPGRPGGPAAARDLQAALVNLGYPRAQAEAAAAETLRGAPSDATLESLVRSALARLHSG